MIPYVETHAMLVKNLNSDNYMERFRLYWKGRQTVITDEWVKERINSLRQYEAEMFSILDLPIKITDAFMALIPVYFFILGFLFFTIMFIRKYCNEIIETKTQSNFQQRQQLLTSGAA